MPARVLCGPVIGLVTADSAIILLEVDQERSVTLTLRPKHGGPEVQCTVSLPARQPRVFQFSGLNPDTRYDVINVDDDIDDYKKGRVNTLPRDPSKINVAVVSCDYPERPVKVDMWKRLFEKRKSDRLHAVLHLGDNVYIDGDVSDKLSNPEQVRNSATGIFDSRKINQSIPYVQARNLIRDLHNTTDWDTKREQILEIYRERYRFTWSRKYTAKVLRTMSNIMILDDHEIRDDFGLLEEDGDPTSREYWLGTLAIQVYHEYQRQLWDPDIITTDKAQSLTNETFVLRLGPLGFIMMDARTSRSVYRPRRQHNDNSYYGKEQLETLKQCLTPGDDNNTRMWLVGCALPLLFFKQKVNKILHRLNKTQDDLEAFIQRSKEDLKPIWEAIRAWRKSRGPSRDIMLLAGDVHVGGFTDIYCPPGEDNSAHTELLCHQITTSPIHNVHWSKLQYWSGQFILEACTDKYDEITYKHYNWINSCNFAIIRMDFGNPRQVFYDVSLVRESGMPLNRNSQDQDWPRSSAERFFTNFFCVRC